jgi:hypothetical protein
MMLGLIAMGFFPNAFLDVSEAALERLLDLSRLSPLGGIE